MGLPMLWPGKKGCLEWTAKQTVASSDMAWNPTVKLHGNRAQEGCLLDPGGGLDGVGKKQGTIGEHKPCGNTRARNYEDAKRRSDTVESDIYKALTRQEEMAKVLAKVHVQDITKKQR